MSYTETYYMSRSMSKVYLNMAASVLNSMLVAYYISHSPGLAEFFLTGAMKWVILLLPLPMVFVIVPILSRIETPLYVAQACLHLFAATVGIGISSIFIVHTSTDITSAFLGAVVLFTILAVYGATTKRNLEGIGQFMAVGLIAIIIAGIVNLFLGSTLLQLTISSLGVIIFLGLTAYDAQRIQELVRYGGASAEVLGALNMYLNFINLFLDLLNIISLSDD